jgi:uncharacterized protein
MSARSHVRSLFLEGPAGRLEALLNTGAPDATHAAVVCHPHPLYRGTMHNKVVFHAMKALNGLGFPVLRFNFRGAGLSKGQHDQGRGEVDDVRAAFDFLHNEYGLPLVFCGFSFGAAVGLRAACPDGRVVGAISLGTPVEVMDRNYAYEFLRGCTKPKLFVSGERDQFGPRAEVEAVVAAAAEPKQVVFIPGADHFFAHHLTEMQRAITDWIVATLGLAPRG